MLACLVVVSGLEFKDVRGEWYPNEKREKGFLSSAASLCTYRYYLLYSCVSLRTIGVGCPYGEYNGEAGCTKCAAGTYSDERGLSECKTCPYGKYQPNEHTTGCLDCSSWCGDVILEILQRQVLLQAAITNQMDTQSGSECGQSGTDIDTNKTAVPGMYNNVQKQMDSI